MLRLLGSGAISAWPHRTATRYSSSRSLQETLDAAAEEATKNPLPIDLKRMQAEAFRRERREHMVKRGGERWESAGRQAGTGGNQPDKPVAHRGESAPAGSTESAIDRVLRRAVERRRQVRKVTEEAPQASPTPALDSFISSVVQQKIQTGVRRERRKRAEEPQRQTKEEANRAEEGGKEGVKTRELEWERAARRQPDHLVKEGGSKPAVRIVMDDEVPDFLCP
eukprot:Sspe_Gene.105383::Locus_82423_Transcript_1_1_Confidence_1.000_Length_727::g.105383::m.105383